MPKEVVPAASAAPAIPAAPAASTPAAPSAPTAPKAAAPARPAKPSTIPKQTLKPKLSAKRALGLDESPRKLADAETKKMRDRMSRSEPVVEFTPPAPQRDEPPAVTAPEVPASAAPEVPAAPAKFKVGEKEYTQEELDALVKKANEPQAAPAPAPAPAAEEEEAPAVPELTPEQVKQKEAEFVAQTAAQLDAPMSEEEIDTILAGGKEAIATMAKIRQRDMATAIMMSRKAIAHGLNPVMNEVFNALKPLVESHQQIQRYTIEQQFIAKHKDFVPHIETARSIAEELVKRYPAEVAKLSPEQFTDEVARQTDLRLTQEHKRWFPQSSGNWRAGLTPAAPAAPAPAAAAPAMVSPPAAPAAPARAAVRPPNANLPSGAVASGPTDWRKSVAQSMR